VDTIRQLDDKVIILLDGDGDKFFDRGEELTVDNISIVENDDFHFI
jgi:hypothetical protein